MIPDREVGTVYPGHPLTIASFILRKYEGQLDVAFETSSHGWPNALSDGDIPGAGDAVYSALQLLKEVREGVFTPDEAVEVAIARWTKERETCGYRDRLEPGNEEARSLAPDFVDLAKRCLSRA